MKLKISFTMVILNILMVFDGESVGQVVERNGVLYEIINSEMIHYSLIITNEQK